ncbi:MAG: Ti-type conjugative transfer relaxase TraA [Phenylobacterium sp.]|uniref:Ti-type conjugative transfer relaxase TraA n=1 Tax=Phenylobacterium sp. TaxID=1871053 RepID=UPI0025F2E1EB|nr:Ti-type conjugative transfer relaxase TraA [Phenylobacterium sp.]MBI1198690.1 Ti-type conjugative transfer relaxase TraA [Phenylobacterium sp.]
MAIYHFSAKVISRAKGSSAVAAAAYRSASRLHDERLDRAHDFSAKTGVVHSEVMLPEGAPERWRDRETLWNEVEAREVRKDAQLAREVEFAIPRELSQRDGVALARSFVQREFVDKGMLADLNVHWDVGADGEAKPHAHVMLALRAAGPEGFGGKVRDWNATDRLVGWREAWAEHANRRLAELGIEARIDARALKDQGIDLEPQNKIGASGARREIHGEAAERAEDHRAIARRNGERILAEPEIALSAITHQQATFTDHGLARFLHRHTDGREQFDAALAKVRASGETVRLGRDGNGRERFTSREMLRVERRLKQDADAMAARPGHAVGGRDRVAALARSSEHGLDLSVAQRDAVDHVTRCGDLALLVGYAGTGKSALLGVARDAWEAQGYRVRGAALSGMAAESLEGGSGIPSRTLASLEHAWARDRETLGPRDVLVVDEAGLVGSRQLGRVMAQAQAAGAKVVMVGDAEQLQAIEAGAAFRALAERHGAYELTEVRRQQVDWQRDSTRQLATGRTVQALSAYSAAGAVRGHDDPAAAREAVVAGWWDAKQAAPGSSQVMLAYTRDDVAALNGLARERMQAAGALGQDHRVETIRGARLFAEGERIVFLRNERELGVKNGTLGTVEQLGDTRLGVRLDDGRRVAFDQKAYTDLDHGYATTIHKSQGVTVDRAHVLAGAYMDRHATYVALSRHRQGVTLHYDRQTFADEAALGRALSRERAKDSTLDYPAQFAERRGLGPAAAGVFDAFRPAQSGGRIGQDARQDELARVQALARAWQDGARMQAAGHEPLAHQRLALDRAAGALDRASPGLAARVAGELERDPTLAASAARGRPEALLRAAMREPPQRDLPRSQEIDRAPGQDRGLER